MYQPSELLAFLAAHGIQANKRLSQNFLVDGNVVRKAVDCAGVEANDVVLEIGPGPGALTQELLKRGARVVAVDKDERLAHALERFQTPDGRLRIIAADFLSLSLQKLLPTQQKSKVVANLPYSITTPILVRLMEEHQLLDSITVLVQKEVAERMAAPAGSRAFGSLSVLVQFWSEVNYQFTVSPHCFYPKPKVSSAVIRLTLRPPPLPAEHHSSFFSLTRHAFNHRRKMLRGSLQHFHTKDDIERALQSCALALTTRPEELSVQQWVALYQTLPATPGREAKKSPKRKGQ